MKTWILCIVASTISILSQAQLQTALQQVMADNQLMGYSVVTICNGEIDEIANGGLKDYSLNLPVDDSTMYRIASISKLVTATGLMNLYEENAFSLDEDISEAMGAVVRNPNFPDVPITYRMLLSHTSSIQDGNGYSDFLSATYNSGPNAPNVTEYLLEEGDYYETNNWRTEQPGTFFTYSNANFGIIGTLIEKLSGMRFDAYMKMAVLDPLEIAGSFNVADIGNISNVAAIYRNVSNSWQAQVDNFQGIAPSAADFSSYVPGTNGFIFAPQGGLRISAFDLAKIMLVHSNLNPGVLESTTIELMHTPQWTYDGANGDNYYGLFRSWGLGVHITTNADYGDIVFDGETMIGHPGEAYGLISDMYFGSQNGSGFIFITNGCFEGYTFGNNSAFYSVEEEIFDAIFSQNIFNCVVGVEETTDLPFQVFPNPAQAEAIIRFNSQETPTKIVVRDVTGRLVWEQNILSGREIRLEISSWSSGTYGIEVHSGDRLFHTWIQKKP
ncbi:MAG: serine hydrolase [Flavobacteriales bacterium]